MDIALSHSSALELLRAYQRCSPQEPLAQPRDPQDLVRPMALQDSYLGECATGLNEIASFGLTPLTQAGKGLMVQGWQDLTDLGGLLYPLPLSNPLNVLVPVYDTNRAGGGVVRRTCTQQLPPESIWRMGKAMAFRYPPDELVVCGGTVLVASPELVFAEYASELSRGGAGTTSRAEGGWRSHQRAVVRMAQLGMELCGSYSTTGGWGDVVFGRKPLTCVERIEDMLTHLPHTVSSRLAHEALGLMANGSASPMETALYLLLCLPRKLGGYALARPVLNRPLPVTPRFKELTAKGTYVPDLFWPEHKLDLEYDSTQFHDSASGLTNQALRTNALASMGIDVRSVTWDMLRSTELTHKLALQTARVLGQRIRTTNGAFSERRAQLRALVLPPVRTLG